MEPIYCEWDGEAFRPLQRHAKQCASSYVIGERYFIEAQAPRDMRQRRAYFAGLNDAWRNLPEEIAEQFPSADHLRKHALCRTGYCTESKQLFTTPRDAVLAAAFAATASDFSIVVVSGAAVRVWKPESQSVKAMGADRFNQSIRDVEMFVAGLIGVTPDALAREAERNAG